MLAEKTGNARKNGAGERGKRAAPSVTGALLSLNAGDELTLQMQKGPFSLLRKQKTPKKTGLGQAPRAQQDGKVGGEQEPNGRLGCHRKAQPVKGRKGKDPRNGEGDGL